ncbi:phosphodiester glycosidase family protein [Paenibacillus thermoaerophilus]|uniref:Phosphodiester glycosidase family protein n=1 Tax=Paenibacillus thermoaerophilus TaxID=1215385 RepID=A0ABW2UYL8_9BACL|nr:phosphodiester glycosidase family protein [Paenibacillus thermoaerophilus]TMV15879.1 phosphodiester glycosidase family protein [Paenibacillus thermoaerophilus]
MTLRMFNRMMLLGTAPFLGMLAWLLIAGWSLTMPSLDGIKPTAELDADRAAKSAALASSFDSAAQQAGETGGLLERFYQLYEQSGKTANAMVQTATAAKQRPELIFENRISSVIGRARKHVSGPNIDLKLYPFSQPAYSGYAMKVRLKTGDAMKMVLGQDKVPGSETTLSAVKRYGAVAGINAGGFADDSRGRRYPLSATVYNGKFVYDADPTAGDELVFVGLDMNNRLVGTRYSSNQEIQALNPKFGASFVPVLLKGGEKQPIPAKWQNSPARAPRTVVGSFSNGQLLFIVTDGRNENGSSGATLAELQDLMLRMRIRDAYNLDGGGSSTLVFDGQLINSPSDGRMRALPTHFLFYK